MLQTRITTGPRSPSIGGFSLIELLAVIAVASVLAAVAIPALSATGSARSAAAARLAVRDLTQARERAIATAVPTWVTFDLGAQTYAVAAESPASPGRASAQGLVDSVTGEPLIRRLGQAEFSGVQLTAAQFDGAPVLGFNWLGAPLNQNETALSAAGQLAFTGGHTVTVEPGTGLASHHAP